eukprot:6460135-Amphidinium_carterae.2
MSARPVIFSHDRRGLTSSLQPKRHAHGLRGIRPILRCGVHTFLGESSPDPATIEASAAGIGRSSEVLLQPWTGPRGRSGSLAAALGAAASFTRLIWLFATCLRVL